MVTETREPEPLTEQQPDEASTPVSDAPAEPSPQVEAPAANAEIETPAAQPPPPVSALAPNEQEAELRTLSDKAYSSGLSAEELRRRDQLQGAHNQRQEAQRRQIEDWERAETERTQALASHFTTAKTSTHEKIEAEITRAAQMCRDVDMGLISEYLEAGFGTAHQKSGEVHTAPIDTLLTNALLHPSMYGDSLQNRRAFAAQSVQQKLAALAERSFEMGKLTGPGEGYKVMSPADLAAHDRKVLDDYKTANPGAVSPSIGGVSGSGGLPNLAQYNAASFEQRAQWRTRLGDDYVDRIVQAGQ